MMKKLDKLKSTGEYIGISSIRFEDSHDLAKKLLELPAMKLSFTESKSYGEAELKDFSVDTDVRIGEYEGLVLDTHICFSGKTLAGYDPNEDEEEDIDEGAVVPDKDLRKITDKWKS